MEEQITAMAIDEEGQHSLDSDHNLITTKIKRKHPPKKNANTQDKNIIKSRWKLNDLDNLKEYSNEVEKVLKTKHQTPTYEEFINIIITAGKKTCGKTKQNLNSKRKYKPKWINMEIKQAIKERKLYNKKYRKLLKDNRSKQETQEAWNEYKDKKKLAATLINKEIKKIDAKLTIELSNGGPQATKKFWRHVKKKEKENLTPTTKR